MKGERAGGSFVEAGGVRVFYRSAGTGHPILLLHGYPTSSYDWRRLILPLSKFGRVLAPDLYGFGHSETPEIIDLSSFLQGFLSALSVERFTFAGYDAGGVLGLSYTVENPAMVKRLILMNTTCYPDWVDHSRTSRSYATVRRLMSRPVYAKTAARMLNRWAVRRILGSPSVEIGREELDEQVRFFKRGIRALLQMRPRPYTEKFFNIAAERLGKISAKVPSLRIPTLIVFGEDDPYFPPGTAEHLHRDISGSKLHVLPKTGHFLMEEQPMQVLGLMTSFLLEH